MSVTYKTILDLKQKSEISNTDLLMIGNEGTGELRQITWQDAIKNTSVDLSDYATKEEINELSEEKADKDYVVSVFEQLKQLIQNGEIDSAVALLDSAILDLSTLA